MSINDRVKQIRLTLNMSQRDFSNKIGLSQGGYNDLEHSRCNVSKQNIILLCSVFNVNPQWLINGTGDMFKNSNQSFNELLSIFERLDKPFQDFILKICYELRNTQDELK